MLVPMIFADSSPLAPPRPRIENRVKEHPVARPWPRKSTEIWE
jgi:hypothetical protein